MLRDGVLLWPRLPIGKNLGEMLPFFYGYPEKTWILSKNGHVWILVVVLRSGC
jgi:hypothetical protein